MQKISKYLLTLLLFLGAVFSSIAQESLLQSGPMVGYSSMREVMLWVQTNAEATVHIEYWEIGNTSNRLKTKTMPTTEERAYTAHLKALVLPGKKYGYELFINGQLVKRNYPLQFQAQVLWQWRTDPPAVKFVMGSCVYVNDADTDRPGTLYGGGYEIFRAIASRQPDFMLWLGDNAYFRETDWDSETGMVRRYTQTRSLPEMQPLLGNVHNYAIWDDHDYGPNNADRGYPYKDLSLQTFKNFWANPNYGVADPHRQGITGSFEWADLQFFLLDNRYFRTPNDRVTGDRHIIGSDQEEWLLDALKSSAATFKFVAIGGQVLNPMAEKENHSRYEAERTRLLQRIRQERIEGVIFLTGDRHHAVLSVWQENNAHYPIYDLTSSPLTAGVGNPAGELNTLMVPNTLVLERNFAELEVSGRKANRVLTIRILNQEGKIHWERTIEAKDLRYSNSK